RGPETLWHQRGPIGTPGHADHLRGKFQGAASLIIRGVISLIPWDRWGFGARNPVLGPRVTFFSFKLAPTKIKGHEKNILRCAGPSTYGLRGTSTGGQPNATGGSGGRERGDCPGPQGGAEPRH